jgi:hypothetical protein
MKKILTFSLCMASGLASAESYQSHDYIDLGFMNNDFGSGFTVAGSFDVKQIEPLVVIGSYSQTSDDYDFSRVSVGAGWKLPLNVQHDLFQRIDLFFHGEIENIQVSGTGNYYCVTPEFGAPLCVSSSLDESDTGLYGGALARWQLTDKLELLGDVSIRTTRDFNIPVMIGANYSFTKNWVLNAEYEFGNYDHISISARYQFN